MFKLTILTVLVAAVAGNNITVGHNSGGRKIYDEKITASPAIWRQVQSISVNATDGDVISKIVVIDNRPYKDGEANITEGGVGQKNVTVELKSPTVFRGFDFNVEVYTVPENEFVQNVTVLTDSDTAVDNNKTQNPINDEGIVPVAGDSTPYVPRTSTGSEKKEVNAQPAILGAVTPSAENKNTKDQNNDNSDLDSVLASIFPPNTPQLVANGTLAGTPVEATTLGVNDHKTSSTPKSADVGQNAHTTETSTPVNRDQFRPNAKIPRSSKK